MLPGQRWLSDARGAAPSRWRPPRSRQPAYVLTLESGERVTADPIAMSRYGPYCAAAEAAPRSTYVFDEGGDDDRTLAGWLARNGGGTRVVVGRFAVFAFDHQVVLAELPALVTELP
jgi:hypothetical protein